MPSSTRLCPVCEQPFYCSPSRAKKQSIITCSRTCAARLFRDKGTWVNCQCCGTSFYRQAKLAKKGFGKYCSRACEAKSRPNQPVARVCIQCNLPFIKDHWTATRIKNGATFCCRSCADTFKRKLRKRGEQEMFTQWQKREWIAEACAKCGSTNKLELDHIHPRFAGGKAEKDNAQTLCRTCNRKKFWETDYALYRDLLTERHTNIVK